MQLEEFNPAGCIFMGTGEGADLDELEASLELHRSQLQQTGDGDGGRDWEGMKSGPNGGVSAVFTEFPSNPLLKCPDLHRSFPSYLPTCLPSLSHSLPPSTINSSHHIHTAYH